MDTIDKLINKLIDLIAMRRAKQHFKSIQSARLIKLGDL